MTISPAQLELRKHRLALILEQRKWEYRQSELRYLEAGQHMRSLNQLMWQVPSMAIAATGGLWYGATLVDGNLAKIGLLVFAAIIDFLTIFIVARIRWVLQKPLEIQKIFEGRSGKEKVGLIVACWIAMLLTATGLSVLGAFNTHELMKKTVSAASPMECKVETTISVNALQPASPPLPVQRRKSSRYSSSNKQCP